ncbi:MAG TPA: carboxypeptidase-like regulatory domain-containing protein [Planctomycetota bacterium]|nr:carboxypeptidase-like regulatory domain-containing protein [Planctomycetota bacterium]
MSRRSLVSIRVGVAVLLVAVIWLLWPEPSPSDDAARPAAAARVAAPPPVFAPPIDDVEPEPLVAIDPSPATPDEALANAVALDAIPRKSLDVGVIMPDGMPLVPYLKAERPALAWISAIATSEPLGERLPESIAPFYSSMGLAEFDRPHRGNANPNPTVAGFIGTLQLPRVMPVFVSLSCGPEVIAVQPVAEQQDSVLFVIDPVTVSRLAGSLRLLVVSAETRQPVEGAAVEVGLGANLSPGGEDGRSDDLGVCELHRLAPGPTQLWVSAPGFEQCGFDVTIPAGDSLDLGIVELHLATRVSGRVVQATGEPVPQAYVTVFLDDAGLRSSILAEPFATTKADDDGFFGLNTLGRRRYALVVIVPFATYADARRALVIVNTTAGPVDDLLVTVEPAPALTVLNPAGRAGVSVHVRNEAAPFVDWWPDIPYLSSPGEQEFNLLPGRYVLEYAVPGQAKRTRSFVLGAEPLTVDLGR